MAEVGRNGWPKLAGIGGRSWPEYASIQEGMNYASDGDTVLVSEGIYYERIDFYGKPIVVASNFIFDHDPATMMNTVINADTLVIGYSDKGSVVTFTHGEDERSCIKGFTITKGTGTRKEISPYDSYLGGGFYCVSSSPVIEFNYIVDNTAKYPIFQQYTDGRGGGIYLKDSTPTIRYNSIESNEAYGLDYYFIIGLGGGIYIEGCQSGTIENNIISNNECGWWGAGIYCENSQLLMRSNHIEENEPRAAGGGIFCYSSSPEIVNNVIKRNDEGGILCENHSDALIKDNVIIGNTDSNGISIVESSPTIVNNSIQGNSFFVTEDGGGIWIYDHSNPVIMNNIVTDNRSIGISSYEGCHPVINYNDVWGNKLSDYLDCEPGERDISCDPNFVDPDSAEDFRLLPTSPCIDAGDPDPQYNDPDGTRNDMGAFSITQPYFGFLIDPGVIATSFEIGKPATLEFSVFNPLQEQSIVLDGWLEFSGPICGVAEEFSRISIPPRENVTTTLNITVPDWFPTGMYTANARVGNIGEEIWDSLVWDVVVTPPPQKAYTTLP